jgi:hypothetical protein
MASAEQSAANRRNAKLSTGPQTASGKLRSKLNALRHGLSARASADSTYDAKTEALAKRIAREHGKPALNGGENNSRSRNGNLEYW